ncbi:MAG: hypothetical protein M0R74_14515, partial [Dehalococcoidia bacterium]|nr:hypothetical protein [Dehalococcoidia bacterium]
MEQDAESRGPEDALDRDPDDDGGWYFDLPSGAWERQEAKSRELRESVRTNADDQLTPDRSDPFASPRKGFFGRGRKIDEPETGRAIAGGKWVLNRDPAAAKELDPAIPQDATEVQEDDDWSTDALPLFRTASTDALPLFRTASSDGPPASDDGRMRWSDAFAGADSDADPLAPMRDWARRPDADAPVAAEPSSDDVAGALPDPPPGTTEPDGDWRPAEALVEAEHPAADTPPLLSLRRREADDDPEPREADTPSRWDEVFSAEAGETSMLDAMRTWAQGSMDTGAPEPGPDDAPREIPAEFLKPFDWETEDADSAAGPASPPGLDATTEPDSSALESERLAESASIVETDAAVAELADPAQDVGPVGLDEDFEDAGVPSPTDELEEEGFWADLPEPEAIDPVELMQTEAPKKRGLFSRLFGRKKKEQPASVDVGGDWIPAEDEGPAPAALDQEPWLPIAVEASASAEDANLEAHEAPGLTPPVDEDADPANTDLEPVTPFASTDGATSEDAAAEPAADEPAED